MLQLILLGVIQGITEFLPVSSSGHLVLFSYFFNIQKSNITLEILLHLGSLFAVLIYYRYELLNLAKSLIFVKDKSRDKERYLILCLAISTSITVAVALFFSEGFKLAFTKPLFVCFTLFFTGVVLLLSDRIAVKEIKQTKLKIGQVVAIGLAQSFAILPGISRSGTTIAVAIFLGVERKFAAKFSFLLSIPAICGAVVFELGNISTLPKSLLASYLIAALFAGVSGYLVIALLIKLVQRRHLAIFSYYLFAFSLISFLTFTFFKS